MADESPQGVKKTGGKRQYQQDGKGQHKYDEAIHLPPLPPASGVSWPEIFVTHQGHKIGGDKHYGENDEIVEHTLYLPPATFKRKPD